ncbi:MAG: inorganic phosphate transporter [Sulfuricaulis sp.]|uniref:anion permease n=1 Tax=Sulfuricaulis sp. TaxID=2003553 RepID=UPI0034A52685
MNTAALILIGTPVLLLAWVNGANDVSRGVATLVGCGLCDARRAIRWGTLFTVLGGLTGILWGGVLAANFSTGFLAPDYRPDTAFMAGAIAGAFGWVGLATRFGWPVSTTHALLGGIAGAALIAIGPDGLHLAVITNKAVAPLLLSPLIAILLCWLLLRASRWVTNRLPDWRPGCCAEDEWRADPYVCAEPRQPGHTWQQRLLRALHWLSAGATSFARGLNDVPKIAAFLILLLAGTSLPQPDAWVVAIALVSLVMGAGSHWAGKRVTRVLAHRVARLDPGQGLTANAGTALLVLMASPLGLPVSTTHVSTGALMGIRFADRSVPTQADALRAILLAWIVTLPAAGILAATATFLSQQLYH